MKASHILWLGIPLLDTLSQLFIKLAAEHVAGSGWAWLHSAVTSPWMMAAAGAEAACFVIWMHVLAELDLSKAFPLSAVSYILILATSWLVFGETISLPQLTGSALILTGVCLVSTAGREALPELRRKGMRADVKPSMPARLSRGRSL